MKIRFDSLDRFEVPSFYICNPGSEYKNGILTRMVGSVTHTSDEEVVLNFNATSELNFRAYCDVPDGSVESEYAIAMYKSLQNRRYIFVEDIGYFVISEIDDAHEQEGRYKDVRAVSCEIEMQNKTLTYIENNTYKFRDLLEKVIAPVSKWTIKHIDDAVAEKSRTFEDIDTSKNTLAFLMEDMQNAYECIFIFDTINRQISAYDQNNYVVRTDIHLTKDDLISSIGISEGTEDLYTALSVFGADNLSITAVNPLGTTVIYNFDYYLDWMSESLRDKVKTWSKRVRELAQTPAEGSDEASSENYYALMESYYNELEKKLDCEAEIDKIQTQIDMYTRCKENIIAESSTESVAEYNEEIIKAGGAAILIAEEISSVLVNIDTLLSDTQEDKSDKESELSSINNKISGLEVSINAIRDSVAITKFFTQEEYDELSDYIYEGTYTDEYIIVTDGMTQTEQLEQMRTLYDRAQKRLQIVSYPSQEFDVEVEDFVFQKEFQQWSAQLETGCLISVELDPDDIAELFLSTIQLNWHDHELSLTFGNRFNKFDPKTLFDNVLGDVQKSANSIDYIKEILYPIKEGKLNDFAAALDASRTLTMNSVLASENEEVKIDATGYTGRRLNGDGEYDPRQVKINSNSIVFTDNAWESCKTALGLIYLNDGSTTYGINAQTVIGEMIIGGELHIKDKSGDDILTVVDNKISSQVSGVSNQAGELEGKVSELFTRIEQTEGNVSILIGNVSDLEDKEVTSVRTTTGYTFDADGLVISKSGYDLCNQLTHDGMYVYLKDGDKTDHELGEMVLQANGDGVNARDITIRHYLHLGDHARFENFSTDTDSNRTACFYV